MLISFDLIKKKASSEEELCKRNKTLRKQNFSFAHFLFETNVLEISLYIFIIKITSRGNKIPRAYVAHTCGENSIFFFPELSIIAPAPLFSDITIPAVFILITFSCYFRWKEELSKWKGERGINLKQVFFIHFQIVLRAK